MSNPFPTRKEFQLLMLLRDTPAGMYGLEIVRQSGGGLSRGSVYVLLGNLVEKGLVRSNTASKPTHPGLPRPVYQITPAGEKALALVDNLGEFSRA